MYGTWFKRDPPRASPPTDAAQHAVTAESLPLQHDGVGHFNKKRLIRLPVTGIAFGLNDTGEVVIKVNAPLFKETTVTDAIPKERRTRILARIKLPTAFSKEVGTPLIGEYIAELERPFLQPVSEKSLSLAQICELVSGVSEIQLQLNEPSLKRAEIAPDQTIEIDASNLNETQLNLRDLHLSLVPELESSTPSIWKVISSATAERSGIIGLYSLQDLSPNLSVRQVTGLLMRNVNSNRWEDLGGPYSISPVGGYRAIAVGADMTTQMGIHDYLRELADLGKRDAADELALRDVWSDQIPIGVLHPVVDVFPLSIDSEPTVLVGDDNFATAIEFLDDERLIWGCTDASLRLWDTMSGEQIREFEASDRPVRCIARIPGYLSQFMIGDGRGEIARYEADSDQSLMRQWQHRGNLNCLAFSVDNKYLFSSGGDGSIIRYTMPELVHDKVGRMRAVVTSVVAFSRYEKGYIALNRIEHEEVWTFDQETLETVAKSACSDPIALLAFLPETPTKRNFGTITLPSMVAGTFIIGGTQLSTWSTPDLDA